MQHLSLSQSQLLFGLLNTLRELDDRLLMLVSAEIVGTQRDLRARVSPKNWSGSLPRGNATMYRTLTRMGAHCSNMKVEVGPRRVGFGAATC